MAQSWLIEVDAINQHGSASVSIDTAKAGVKFPPNVTLRAFTSLVYINHADQQNSFAANCYISHYIQNGVPHPPVPSPTQQQRLLIGNGITDITVTVDVNGCEARGILIIDVV